MSSIYPALNVRPLPNGLCLRARQAPPSSAMTKVKSKIFDGLEQRKRACKCRLFLTSAKDIRFESLNMYPRRETKLTQLMVIARLHSYFQTPRRLRAFSPPNAFGPNVVWGQYGGLENVECWGLQKWCIFIGNHLLRKYVLLSEQNGWAGGLRRCSRICSLVLY